MDSMGALGLGIVLTLKDRVSSGLETIRQKMAGFSAASQEMIKNFDAGAKQLLGGIASIVAGVKVFGTVKNVLGSSIETAANFEQAMARVKAVSGATGEAFEALRKQAEELGRDTQFSASQTANAQELLARAGFNYQNIIKSMPSLLDMAAAEGMELSNAADIASNTLRGFGLQAEDMKKVADILAATSSSTNTSIATLGESFKYVSSTAHALRIPIEEVASIIGVLGNAGIKASQSGTYLRGALNQLSKPSKSAQKALSKLGVKLIDPKGELLSFDEIFTQFSQKMKGMTGVQRLNIFGEIFDTRAATGMLAVLDQFEAGALSATNNILKNLDDNAHKMAQTMNDTAQGALKRLESATEGLRIAIGNHLLPIYAKTINKIAEFKSWLTKLIKDHPILSKAILGVVTSLTALASAALIAVGTLATVAGAIKLWKNVKPLVIAALFNMKSQALRAVTVFKGMLVPITALIVLAGALYLAWRKNFLGIRDMVRAITEGFKMAVSASKEGIAEVDDAVVEQLKKAGIWDFAVLMGQVFWRVRQFAEGFIDGLKDAWSALKSVFNWVAGIFNPVIESGQELLKLLGILDPIAQTQANSWRAWGQLLGRIAAIVLSVWAAFKMVNIAVNSVKLIGNSLIWLGNLAMKHPFLLAITVIIGAIYLLYTHWDEVKEFLVKSWNVIKQAFRAAGQWITSKILAFSNYIEGKVKAVADWFKSKWQGVKDWWNSWTLKDIFAPVLEFAKNVKNNVLQNWEQFSAWWSEHMTLSNIFESLLGLVDEVIGKIEGKWTDFKNWLTNLFPDWMKNMLGINEVPKEVLERQEAENQKYVAQYPQANADNWAKAYGIQKPPENPNIIKTVQGEKIIQEIPSAISEVKINQIVQEHRKKQQNEKLPVPPSENWQKAIKASRSPALQTVLTQEVPVIVPNTDSQIVQAFREAEPIVKPQPQVMLPQWNASNWANAFAAKTPQIPPAVPEVKIINSDTGEEVVRVLEDFTQKISPVSLPKEETAKIIQTQPKQENQSTPYIIQHSQNQANMTGAATVQAVQQTTENLVKVDNNVDVKISGEPVNISLDGERIAAVTMRYVERHTLREGRGDSL